MDLYSAQDLLKICEDTGWTMSEVVLHYEAERSGETPETVRTIMEQTLAVMQQSVQRGLEDPGHMAHLAKAYGKKLAAAAEAGNLVGGRGLQRITMYALAVAQHNAALGRIVACPTAGSCGVVPGALLAIGEELSSREQALIDGLLAAAGIGVVSAAQGPIAGAEGGCQAECGVASAMAAGAVVCIMGGTPGQMMDAASLALQNLLGLVCDPVAGLVEIPCITRNACAAGNAVMAANMVMAGISSLIPYDETVQAMKLIGRAMPESLRETAKGGLAATPTARRIHRQMQREHHLEDE